MEHHKHLFVFLVLFAVAGLATCTYVAIHLLATSSQATNTTQTTTTSSGFQKIENAEGGFFAEVPQSWTQKILSEPDGGGGVARTLVLMSADYSEREASISAELGNDVSTIALVASGSKITIPLASLGENNLSPSIRSPQAFTDFNMEVYSGCSNCKDVHRVMVSGEPAMTHRAVFENNGMRWEVTQLELIKGDRPLHISYDYAVQSAENDAVFEHFFQTFTLLKK